jgi:hypothetical protein
MLAANMAAVRKALHYGVYRLWDMCDTKGLVFKNSVAKSLFKKYSWWVSFFNFAVHTMAFMI